MNHRSMSGSSSDRLRTPALSPIRPGDGGCGSDSLTLRKAGRIVPTRDGNGVVQGERTARPVGAAAHGTTRLSGSPHMDGRGLMSHSMSRSSGAAEMLRRLLRASTAFVVLASAVPGAQAQNGPIIQPGFAAVTGFSGSTIPFIEEGLPPGVDPIEETFIDLDGATLRIFDPTILGGPAAGQLAYLPVVFEAPAGQIGQVFGLAYDDGLRDDVPDIVPNLYAAASSLHGMRIVAPDGDGDGRPERLRRGAAGATFMAGQWGEELAGGPGAIWKIDGLTGEVTLFANVAGNSGPGFGNIAFDKAHRQFLASDLDSGLIYRIGVDGTVIDSFDHGLDGRAARGLEPLADDGAVMDIAGAAFDSEDPESWGYTQDERRVWGLAMHGGRLYYAVGEAAEIWSVGIARDGGFAGDPRWELTVTADRDLAVTDIAFDGRGFMYLAQRGPIDNRYDYTRFADSGRAEVIRYWRESPDDPATESIWVKVPQEYAIGFPQPHRQSAGGIDLQYGYFADGYLNPDACAATLFSTGDRLRDDRSMEEELIAGGPLDVHGLQINSTGLTKPQNEPPFGSWFVDYDGFFDDPELRGHVGDVEIWRPCEGRAGYYEPLPGGGFLPPYWPPEFPPETEIPPCLDVEDVAYWCTPAGLEADLYTRDVTGIGGDSIKASSRTPGTLITPDQQTKPAGTPFTIGINGHFPGDAVDVGLCFYRQSDADAGGYYPCCKVVVTLETPPVACEP